MDRVSRFTWPDKTKLSKGAFSIIKKLKAKGHAAYIAGGALRDAILKRPIAEIDIATSARPSEVKKLFPKTIPTGEKHGTVTIIDNNNNSYEITTFRKEGKYLDYRRPDKVSFVRAAEIDAKRRDFTINALFYDPDQKQVLDCVGGLPDLKKKEINLVGSDEARIKEDALRMLRAVRLATVLDFKLAKAARQAIKRNIRLIKKISAERIKQELDKIMLSDDPALGFRLMDEVGLLKAILPEVKALRGVAQPKNQHSEGNVYKHTLLALSKIQRDWDLSVRYGVLFHDLGKSKTRKVIKGRTTFYNHAKVGEELVSKIGKRLKFSNEQIEQAAFFVRYHLVPMDLSGMKLGTRRKWGLKPYFLGLLRVFLADVRASIPSGGKAVSKPRGYRLGLQVLDELKEQPKLKKPILSGHDVMKILKIKPGPRVGEILKLVEEQKLAGEIKTKQDAKKFVNKIAKNA